MKQATSATSAGMRSPDEIAVFQAYVDLINSERETLWARHNALLLANSLIIGALAISPTALWERKWAALAMLVLVIGLGVMLSINEEAGFLPDHGAAAVERPVRPARPHQPSADELAAHLALLQQIKAPLWLDQP